MAFEGADPAQLRQLARRFDTSANQLQQLAAQITAKVNASQAWQGPDANRFRSEWNGQYRRLITTSTTALHEGSQALQKNAQEQERASSGSGGPGGVSGTGSAQAGPSLLDEINNTLKSISGSPIQTIRGYVGKGVTVAKLIAAAKYGTLTKPLEEGGKFAKLIKGIGDINSGAILDKGIGLFGDEGSLAGKLSKLGPFAKGLGVAGGAIGVITGGIKAFQGFSSGDTHKGVDGVLDAASGGLGIAAALSPPPADLICGAAALAVWGGEEIYDHWGGITHGVSTAAHAVEHVGSEVVDGVENAGKSIAHGAENVVHDVGHALNPANW